MALQGFVIQINHQGYNEQTIYDSLYSLALEYQKKSQQREYEILLDVLDMITGWYNGMNVELN